MLHIPVKIVPAALFSTFLYLLSGLHFSFSPPYLLSHPLLAGPAETLKWLVIDGDSLSSS